MPGGKSLPLVSAGAWDAGTAYYAGQIVTVSGASYVCILAHTNHTPPNATYWDLLAAKGDTGATGSAGATGAAGAAGAGYGGTSVTSLTIGTGSKVFTTQAGLAYVVGSRVRATKSDDATKWMEGEVTAYSGTSLTIDVDLTSGSGTIATWTLSITGEPGAAGSTPDCGLTGIIDQETSGTPSGSESDADFGQAGTSVVETEAIIDIANDQFVIPAGKGGVWIGVVSKRWYGHATGYRYSNWRLNGVNMDETKQEVMPVTAASNEASYQSIFMRKLAAGDTLKIRDFQNSGTTLLSFAYVSLRLVSAM